MKEQVYVSAIVYAHNDQKHLGESMRQLDAVLYNTFEHYEIIVVNDGSLDETQKELMIVSELLMGTVIMLNLSRFHGVEKAMMAGLIKSMGDFVFEIENIHFDFDTSQIPTMYHTAMKGNDIVVLAPLGSVSTTSKMFYKVINKVTYLRLDLKTETVRLVSRRALNAMLNLKEKVRYRKALYAFTGYSKADILYSPLEDQQGKRKKSSRENVGTAFDIIVSFSNIGLKSAHYLSIVFFAFSLFMGGYGLYNYIFNQSVVEGWTTLMILISFGFAGLFFIVGMLGEYISRIMIELQDRPFYTTRSVDIYKPKVTQESYLFHSMDEVAASNE